MAPVQRKGLKALQLWCQRVTAGYPHVNITNLGASFRDGLAFNAIIHHFRPHLFDFDSLDPADVRENNAHAFRIAERELDIPALLDPEDMVDCEEPDKFSISTYLAQFYHLFKNETSLPVPSPRANLTRLSSSESENDSLLAGGSEASSPASGPPAKSFDRSSLIAKYGEDIFSSAKDDVVGSRPEKRGSAAAAAAPRSSSSRVATLTPTNLLTLYGDDRRPSPFNRAELVAKYGEDIFSSSKDDAKNSEEEPEAEPKFLRGKRIVGVKSDSSRQSPKVVANVCKQFEMKAKISAS